MPNLEWDLIVPKKRKERINLRDDLKGAFRYFGLSIQSEFRLGGIGDHRMAFRVNSIEAVNFKYLVINFYPNAWEAFASRNKFGLAVLETLCLVINRDPKEMDIEEAEFDGPAYKCIFSKR
ncbi:hypothetical protein A2954_01360 [Candidatus Roizmanbacteria bacterium RIFCSPLOWO2_01_FULL_37_12]|uniref:Uncharacterized protein n=1 Tax=Candidatus Roizmanbacteria bacterium RIFCSPLOWO2_01_FULL_37_12 TaxID=1802056 RepID=A0A1F7IGI6_9BACT|nr:MAG: hypothetical protein A3D76_05930 [Candidatus Roizmanbacteria bacterium RIFCSPHIGHO2_02_FULL_37_9b]OGK42473.1 MAG: hypothetical protein A2954_01360 [Candidatus Roizmanbacteria bacterium RIFCSPLOWO2_01_FULL_37_12]